MTLDWSTILNVAAVASSAAAGVGLIMTAYSVRASDKSSDLDTLFLLLKEISEAETRLLSSLPDPEAYARSMTSYLNLLETMATAENDGLFNRATRKIACDRLVNDIALLQSTDAAIEALNETLTSPSTFHELRQFCRRHSKAIAARQAIIQATATNPRIT